MELLNSLIGYLLSTESSSFWAMCQFFAVVVSLSLIYRQISLHRFSNMLNMISSIDIRWNSQDLLEHRQAICRRYKKRASLSINREEGEVLSFFEDLGIFVQKGVLDTVVVWDKYSYYVEHYWAMYKPHIDEYRISQNDDSWYERFEYLHNRMFQISKKRKLKVTKTKTEIDTFIAGELGSFLTLNN